MRNGELSKAPADAEIRTAFPLFSPPRERGTGLCASARRRVLEVSREPTRARARESARSNRNPIVDAWAISVREPRQGFLPAGKPRENPRYDEYRVLASPFLAGSRYLNQPELADILTN